MNESTKQKQEEGIDFKQFFGVVWGLKWFMLITAVLCLAAAVCYIKLTHTQYTSNASIMVVNKDNTGSAEVAILSDLTGMSKTNKAINEAEVIKSNSLMQKVVEQLGLNYTYVKCRRLKPVYYDFGKAPFKMLYSGIENNPHPVPMHIRFTVIDGNRFEISEIETDGAHEYELGTKQYNFGENVPFEDDFFIINRVDATMLKTGDKYEIIASDSFNQARSLKKGLEVSIAKTMDRSDIIGLKYVDILPLRGEAILNSLIFQYNADARSFRNKANANTLEFLDERLAFIENELNSIEGKYQNYKRDNVLVNVDSQSQLTLTTDERYEAQYNEVLLQIELLSFVRDYINKMKGERSVIPANIGISDPGLNSTINQFNTLLLERNRMAASSSESNPLVVNADAQIDDLISSIEASVRNLDRSYKLQKDNLAAKLREGKRKISNIPTQQLALSNFSRQQQIKEPLYILLQQKREEAMIALCSVADQCKVIDGATGTSVPTAPNKKMILFAALLLGLCLPPAIFFLHQALKSSVDGKNDITSRTSLPLLASIPKADTDNVIIRSYGREPYEEAIRVLRSQFRYFPHKVYQVLSSTPGEGKTFVSSNISAALAHAGKRVLLIGLDLRKPRLYDAFKPQGVDRNKGLVTYLIGRTDDINEVIIKNINGIEGLDVILAGSIPPNPSELIESERMKSVMEYLRSLPQYDYIILDSCPFLSVADSTIVNDYADANIFVMRSGSTALRFVSELDEIASSGKLKNVLIVLNSVDVKDRSYGYYNGYGYGKYGYGKYGKNRYGYGYVTDAATGSDSRISG